MKKIMIGLIIAGVIVGAGYTGIMKHNEKLLAQYTAMEVKEEVRQGDLSITVSGTGNIELLNSESGNLNELKLAIEVDELDINKIKLGQEATIKVNSFNNEEFKGNIIAISEKGTTVNGVTTYSVEISLPNVINEIGKINADDVTLRQGPSYEYMTIKTLANGEDIKILSKEGKWYKVSLSDGAEGWINSAYITVGAIDKEGIEGITVQEVVNVRKGSSTNYGIVTKITEGNIVKVIDKDNNWYKVKLSNDQEGWVEASSISVQKIKEGMSATATILVNEKKEVLYLPVECISKTDEGYVVYPVDGTDYRTVTIGDITDNFVEIIDGVTNGEKVKVLQIEESSDEMY